jgi:hypothetical protein
VLDKINPDEIYNEHTTGIKISEIQLSIFKGIARNDFAKVKTSESSFLLINFILNESRTIVKVNPHDIIVPIERIITRYGLAN